MKKLVCMGDSLTEGSDIDKPYRWPSLLANVLPIEVDNQGIGGDTSAGILARFPAAIGRRPDFVIVLGGTNDLWWNLETNPILANIFAICCQANHHGIAPIVGTPLPIETERVKSFGMTPPMGGMKKCETKLKQLVKAIKASAKQSEIACVDFHQSFLNENGGAKKELFLDDGLHPNRLGHRLMAKTALETIRGEFLL